MDLQSFCLRAGLAVAALGVAGYAALALCLPAPARLPAPLARTAAPVLLAAAPGGATPAAAAAVALAAPPPALAALEPAPVVRASVPPSAAPLPRPVHRAPEPRAGHSARASASGSGGREHTRPAHAMRTAAQLAGPAEPADFPLTAAGGRAWASRRTY